MIIPTQKKLLFLLHTVFRIFLACIWKLKVLSGRLLLRGTKDLSGYLWSSMDIFKVIEG